MQKDSSLSEIPRPWRSAVVAILRRGRDIKIRRRAQLDWNALTLNPFDVSLFAALADALSSEGVKGRPVTTMAEPGETYEFVFDYDADHGTVAVYAKLNLQPDGKVVIIYSAHRPLKQDDLTA
jgi:hypothetical protein